MLLLLLLHQGQHLAYGSPCDVTIPGCTCWQEHGRRQIYCRDPDMDTIPTGSTNPVAVYSLQITEMQATLMEPTFFLNLQIERLYLSGNNITRIDRFALTPSSESMVYLDLSDNQLGVIPTVVKDLHNLKTLVLTGNRIISVYLDEPLEGIQSLHLDANPLLYTNLFSTHASSFASDLRKLTISFRMTPGIHFVLDRFFIPSDMRDDLRILTITDTLMSSSTPIHLGQNFENLEYLGLEGDRLSLTAINRQQTFESVKGTLRGLSLANNLLDGVPDRALRDLVLLEELDLSDNNINGISGIPSLPVLEVLNLEGNTIRDVSNFPPLSNLKVLHLGRNMISSVQEGDFSGVPGLQHLDLRDNRLTTLTPLVFTNQDLQNMQLLIGRNPWSCDCSNQCLIMTIQHDAELGEGPYVMSDMYQDIRCATGVIPNQLLVDVYLRICCDPQTGNACC